MALFVREDMRSIHELPFAVRQLVEAELDSDESLRWAGQPRPWRFVRKTLPIVLFAIPWTAFAIFWICGAAGFKIPDFKEGWDLFPLFGLPFVLVGLGMFNSPLWMIRKAKSTVYIVTNKRAIICQGGWGTSIRSFGRKQLQEITRNQMADGSGDLVFDYEVSSNSRGNTQKEEIGFLGINKVREVEQMLKDISA